MWRSPAVMFSLIGRLAQVRVVRMHSSNSCAAAIKPQISNRKTPSPKGPRPASLLEDQGNKAICENPDQHTGSEQRNQIGKNVSKKDKIDFLVNTLLDIQDSKEAVYGALDAWVAWEHNFPIASLKRVLTELEKQMQWHRVVQVIKWMLSKGQGNTMGTYGQLLRALDMDHRAEEAHMFWLKKIGADFHCVPWQLCNLMISVYYRNNMLESIVKLFKGLEAFDRKPTDKAIVQKVADAYEMLGMLEDKERLLQKYDDLLNDREDRQKKKYRYTLTKKKSGREKTT